MLYNDHTNIQQHKNNGSYAEHLLKYSNIKIMAEYAEHLLKPCPIHAHNKLKNFFARGLHDTYCLHSSTTAPWLHKEPKRR